jgi:hypothetical protein
VQIERSFLSSRVARRVFFLFILCALLPVGALSLVSFSDVTGQLTQQAERRVRQESKAMGMAIYQRLLLLEAEAAVSISRQHPGDPGSSFPARSHAASRFHAGVSWMAHLSIKGWTAQVLLGELRMFPALSPAQWSLLRQQ